MIQRSRSNRKAFDVDRLRYSIDMTDEELALIPLAKHGARKCSVNVREVVNGLLYVLSAEVSVALRNQDLPPEIMLSSISTRGLTTG